MTPTELDNFKQMANAVAERTEELIERARRAEARVAVLEAALRPVVEERSFDSWERNRKFARLTLARAEYEAACRAMEDAAPEVSPARMSGSEVAP